MNAPRPERRLSERERLEVRKWLRALDQGSGRAMTRIGRPPMQRDDQQGDVSRHRFGLALCILSVFLMAWVATLPDQDGRWFFSGIAWLTMFIGGWQIDKARAKG